MYMPKPARTDVPTFISHDKLYSLFREIDDNMSFSVSTRLLVLLALAVTVAVVGAAAVAPSGDDVEDERESEKVVERMIQNYQKIDDVRGEVRVQTETARGVRTKTERFWARPGETYRGETVRSGAGSPNTTLVVNESAAWYHVEDDDEVFRAHPAFVDLSTETPVSDVRAFEKLLETYDVRYAGTETVAGREAHVVHFTPPEDTDIDRSINVRAGQTEYQVPIQTSTDPDESLMVNRRTLWIDAEDWHPIRDESEIRTPEGTAIRTYTYGEFTIDAGVDDDRFAFEPPEGAAVHEGPFERAERYDSVDAAADAVELTVPRPDVPAQYELREVLVLEENDQRAVVQWHEGANDTLLVGVADHPPAMTVEGERVEFASETGTLVRQLTWASLRWQCDGRHYRVRGSPDGEELPDVARSLDCS